MFSIGVTQSLGLALGVLGKLVDAKAQKKQQKHQLRMKELEIISNSSQRDLYAKELLLDKLLGPIEDASHQIQNTAKHAQYLAEVIPYYYADHQLTQAQATILATELRALAKLITGAESLYDLKLIYEAASDFLDVIAEFRHKERKYCLNREIRRKILDPLNTCIGTTHNFQRRLELHTTL
ncbi:MAG: hypothetical protein VKK80_11115 [Prochlorothrix sp.]|nr:hypothetical protein [Prochlorothrix sp.]